MRRRDKIQGRAFGGKKKEKLICPAILMNNLYFMVLIRDMAVNGCVMRI